LASLERQRVILNADGQSSPNIAIKKDKPDMSANIAHDTSSF
jgi:hypothetical protein